ncbi:MAG: radical SAM protein, partial [Candidatus Krumholzibacteria bacterium]|nr:radical SAM protein [Candidatus Krumholzibacteria bacterium]
SEAGGFEITLLGQTISSYQHGGDDFVSLLRNVSCIDGIKRIRFMTSYPTDLNEQVFDAIADLPKVENRIHLPVQSGSDRVLRKMNRHYDLAQYEAILLAGRERIDGLQFSTDLIVGFPGEQEDDFQATLQLMERQKFVSSFLFKYSPREGTLACRSEDDVPESVKSERLARLMELQEATTVRLLQAQVGEELEILLDEESKKAKNQLRGRTRNNMRVIVDPKKGTAIGDFAVARITGFKGGTLTGELL